MSLKGQGAKGSDHFLEWSGTHPRETLSIVVGN
jgi:hypothetical protein